MIPGLHLTSLRLKKTICFDDVSFKFEPGVTVIYGLNRTNAKTSSNGNGAGKSAFFSQLGEILYETPIVGEKQDAVKNGGRTLVSYMRGRKVSVNRVGAKLDVKIDGQSKFRTKPMAKAWLAKNIPVTQQEFDTYVHIDARVPHPLVMGSSTERKKFFTSFFGLDKLDYERKLITAELTKLSRVRAAYAEVLKEYREARLKEIEPAKLDVLKLEVKSMQEQLTDLNAKNIKLQTIGQLLAFEVSAATQLKVLQEILPTVDIEGFDELVTSTKKNLKADQEDLADAVEYEQYQRDTAHYTEAYTKLTPDAAKLVSKLGAKEAAAKCVAANKDLRVLNAEIKELTGKIRVLDALLSEPLPDRVKAPAEDSKELRAALEAAEHQYEHARKFKTGTCGECGQAVKVKDVGALKAKIEDLEAKLEAHDGARVYAAAKKLEAERSAERTEFEDVLQRTKAQVPRLERYAAIADELVSLPRRPRPFEGRKLEVKIKQRMVDEDKERLQLLMFLRPNLDTIIALKALTEKQRNAGSMAVRLQAKVNDIHEKLSKVRAKIEVNELVATSVLRLRKRLREMKVELENEDALKLLVEGYGERATKRMAIKAISSRLMTEVNKYARFVFAEDYTFDFAWDTSQLSLIVNRKNGESSDVRKLSGAESKLFTLVLVLALLTFVPARKRCNVLILDEPTANFSEETIKQFQELVPVLNKVIPSIIIITPKSDFRHEGATNWTMMKVNGKSQLVPGHPSEYSKRKVST